MSAHTKKRCGDTAIRRYGKVLLVFILTSCLPAISSDQKTHAHASNMWDILIGSDLLNVIILAIAIIYLGNRFLPKIIDQRKNQISKELEEAKKARIKAQDELEAVKEKTRQAKTEIEGMKEEAKKTAIIIKKQIEEETEKELENLKLKIKREINTNREEAVRDIKRSASEAAIKLAEEALSKIAKNEEIQKKLTADFLAEIK